MPSKIRGTDLSYPSQPWSTSMHQDMERQQTQQQHAEQQGMKSARKRLRDSCNSCALSKVKCSRDQPTCERCIDRGIYCAYSPSRRTGKRRVTTSLCLPSASMGLSQFSVGLNTPTKESFSCDFDFSEVDEATNRAAGNVNPQLLMDTNDGLHSPELSDAILPWTDPFFAAILDDVANDTSEFYSSRFTGSQNDPINNQDASYPKGGYTVEGTKSSTGSANSSDASGVSEGYETDTNQKGPRPETNSLEEFFKCRLDIMGQDSQPNINSVSLIQNCPSVSNRKSSPTGVPRDCMTVALNALQSLHRPQLTCTIACEGDSTSQTRAQELEIDDVLTKNKEIMDTVATTLRCSCSLDAQLALILTCIAFKIIAWYSAVARSDDEQDAPLSASASTAPLCKPAPERVSHMPIMVGKYHFVGDDRVRMRAQIALGELHRVVQLIEQLGQSFQGVGQETDVAVVDDGEDLHLESHVVPTLIGPMLVSFLQDRVRSVTSETIGILKQSQQIP